MPDILDCRKWILGEQDIRINPNGLSLDVRRAKGMIRFFDRNAIEEAVLLVSRLGHTVDALICGAPAARQSLGIPDLFEQYPHITNEALKFMFTVDGKVSEKMTQAIGKYPRVSFGVPPRVTRYRRRLFIYGGHRNGSDQWSSCSRRKGAFRGRSEKNARLSMGLLWNFGTDIYFCLF